MSNIDEIIKDSIELIMAHRFEELRDEIEEAVRDLALGFVSSPEDATQLTKQMIDLFSQFYTIHDTYADDEEE